MLPRLRFLPVGGVLIALLALVLGFTLPGASRARLGDTAQAARGPLADTAEHPEWRQFLILAALRRADELNHLRDLPDRPTITAPAAQVAGLPDAGKPAEPGDETGSVSQEPASNIPVDIGETSSTELPVAAPKEEHPPVITTPERARLPKSSERKPAHKRKRTAAAKPDAPAQFNLFGSLFGNASTTKAAGSDTGAAR